MSYTENTLLSIEKAYAIKGNIYSPFSFMPWFIIIVCFYIIVIFLIKIEVNSSTNWDIDKCSSKYVFFSGFMKNEKDDPFKQTINNFRDCINPIYNKLIK